MTISEMIAFLNVAQKECGDVPVTVWLNDADLKRVRAFQDLPFFHLDPTPVGVSEVAFTNKDGISLQITHM